MYCIPLKISINFYLETLIYKSVPEIGMNKIWEKNNKTCIIYTNFCKSLSEMQKCSWALASKNKWVDLNRYVEYFLLVIFVHFRKFALEV